MTFFEIIESIRAIINNEKPAFDISEFLFKHRCFHLLSKLKGSKYSHKSASEILFNKIALTERYKTCTPLFQALNETQYAVIKGAVLSKAAYGDISHRISGDIDILVNRHDIDAIKKIMFENGFIQGRVTDNGIDVNVKYLFTIFGQ